MPHRIVIAAALVAALVGTLGGCERVSRAPEDTALAQPSVPARDTGLLVVASIPPQAYLMERLAPTGTSIVVLVGPGQSPETYDPTPAQMTELANADMYFRIGLPFEERLLEKLSTIAPNLAVVDTREGIELRHIEGHTHAEGGEGHEAGQLDPHIWLAPRLFAKQAVTVANGLQRLLPGSAAAIERSLSGLLADLDRLDGEIAAMLKPFAGQTFYVFHPAFGYFADAYGLRQAPIETGGKEPAPQQLATLMENASAAGARVIFVQPEFATAGAEAVARQIGATVVPLDPLSRDYIANLRGIAAGIAAGLGGTTGAGESGS